MYIKAHALLVRLRNKRFIGIALLGLAAIRERQQRLTEAEDYLKDATAIFSELGWEDELPECDAQIKSLHKRLKSMESKDEVQGLIWYVSSAMNGRNLVRYMSFIALHMQNRCEFLVSSDPE
ncbi:hypothetical protein FRC00_008040 [Tulasnella sp. 408]|nr:hypothetical protein FRC00_008040 [Tulasnella sp. 408]